MQENTSGFFSEHSEQYKPFVFSFFNFRAVKISKKSLLHNRSYCQWSMRDYCISRKLGYIYKTFVLLFAVETYFVNLNFLLRIKIKSTTSLLSQQQLAVLLVTTRLLTKCQQLNTEPVKRNVKRYELFTKDRQTDFSTVFTANALSVLRNLYPRAYRLRGFCDICPLGRSENERRNGSDECVVPSLSNLSSKQQRVTRRVRRHTVSKELQLSVQKRVETAQPISLLLLLMISCVKDKWRVLLQQNELEVHSVERIYLRQRCFDASKPRVAASTGPQYQYVHGIFPT